MHCHDLDNQWIESLLERHIYSRGLGTSINMRPSYPHKHITLESRHRDDHIISSKVLVILIFGGWDIGSKLAMS